MPENYSILTEALAWLPTLFVIGLFLVVVRRSKRNVANVMALNQEILANSRRMVAVLEEISAELKQRKS